MLQKIINYFRSIITNTEWENKVYVVGGCVRDLLLGLPLKDIDLVVESPIGGIKFTEWLYNGGLLSGDPVLYPNYGTSMFRLKEFPEIELEAVCTRKEKYTNKLSRNPETVFGTLEEDCRRRDLTINSLYINISSGELIDILGGKEDLQNKRLRTTSSPAIIFEDDPLRILRVIRFWGRLGNDWKIDPEVEIGMKSMAKRLLILSSERVNSELSQILLCQNVTGCLVKMADLDILKFILRPVHDLIGCKQGPQHFGDVFEHTLAVIEKTPPILTLRLAALFHDVGKPRCQTYDDLGRPHFYGHEIPSAEITEEILRSLRYSNDIIERVKFLVKNHMRFKQGIKPRDLRKLMYLWGKDKMMDLLILVDADNKSHAPEYCLPEQVKEIREFIQKEPRWFTYTLPLSGNDIMEIKNIQPSILVKKYLQYLLKYKFSHPEKTEEDLIEELRHVKPNNLPKRL